MLLFSTLLLSMFITLALTPVFRILALKVDAMDVPNARKVHACPIPKCGGLAMAFGTFVPFLLWAPSDPQVKWILAGAAVIVVAGVIDDMVELGYRAKFFAQVITALIVILGGGVKIQSLGALMPSGLLLPDAVAVPLTLLVIVGATNAVNLSDGLDGLAGGVSLLCFGAIGYLAYAAGNTLLAILAIAVVGAIFGFLRFNTFPANLFMGDAGSELLGFLAATLSIALTQTNQALNPLLPLLLLGFPLLDTLAVMTERIVKGKSPFVADKNHFHHKLMRLGFFHTEAVAVIYVLQAFLVTLAVYMRFYSEWSILALYLAFAGVIIGGFTTAERHGWAFKRTGFFDLAVKTKLKAIRESHLHIHALFKVFQATAYGLVLVVCFIPSSPPPFLPWVAAGLLALMAAVAVLKPVRLTTAVRLSLYLVMPILIYLGDLQIAQSANHHLWKVFYNLSFGLLAGLAVLTLKMTRRKMGYRVGPMDVLILFVALVVPNLPDPVIRSYAMSLVAAKIVALFFGLEVLIGELRGNAGRLGLVCAAALLIVAVRGLF